MEIDGCEFGITDLNLGRIKLPVKVGPHAQPRSRRRRTDEIDNDLVTLQGTAPPILSNL